MKYHCPQCGSKNVRIEDSWLICENCGRIWHGYLKHLRQRLSSRNQEKHRQEEEKTMKSLYNLPLSFILAHLRNSSSPTRSYENQHLPIEKKDTPQRIKET